jgi:hypothetical protein
VTKAGDIKSSEESLPIWDAADPVSSLSRMYDYAEGQAKRAINWYYQRKTWKGRSSRLLRLLTIVFTASAGIIPIVSTMVPSPQNVSDSPRLVLNQLGYIAAAIAAFCVVMDRYSGSSSSWMRYVTTATALETLIEELRWDWTRILAGAGKDLAEPEHQKKALERLCTFSSAARALVAKETQDWVSEFRTNLTQLEDESKQAGEAAREAARKDAEDAQKRLTAVRDALQPGALDLTVQYQAALPDGYAVELDGRVHRAQLTGPTCGIPGVSPGLHEVAVIAALGDGKRLVVSRVVEVEPNEKTAVTIDLK